MPSAGRDVLDALQHSWLTRRAGACIVSKALDPVIPGWSEGPDPESRDSGLALRAPRNDMPMRLPFFYGWMIVAVTFVTMAIGVNARTAFSLFFPPIIS